MFHPGRYQPVPPRRQSDVAQLPRGRAGASRARRIRVASASSSRSRRCSRCSDVRAALEMQMEPRRSLVPLAQAVISMSQTATAHAADQHGHRADRADHGGAEVPAADVRVAARPVAAAAAARARNGRAEQRARARDELALRRGVHGRPQLRDGARAVVARLSDRSARHVLRPVLGFALVGRRRGRAIRFTPGRTGRSAIRRPRRRAIAS